MIVSHPARVLFVHVQKTGGSTVQSVLLGQLAGAEKLAGLPGAKHAHLTSALRTHPELADYWILGFVRNPWARLWSWYSMIERRREMREAGNAWAETRIQNNAFWSGVLDGLPDFESFVMEGPERFARLRTPQIGYLRAPGRRADFIGRTEELASDLARVCERLGIDPPPVEPRRNAGPGGDHREHFTPAMRQRVADLYAADLREFGYEF